MGPQGIVFEVTPDKAEVWRWISPVGTEGSPSRMVITRQHEARVGARYSLFCGLRYPPEYGVLATETLEPGEFVEEGTVEEFVESQQPEVPAVTSQPGVAAVAAVRTSPLTGRSWTPSSLHLV